MYDFSLISCVSSFVYTNREVIASSEVPPLLLEDFLSPMKVVVRGKRYYIVLRIIYFSRTFIEFCSILYIPFHSETN